MGTWGHVFFHTLCRRLQRHCQWVTQHCQRKSCPPLQSCSPSCRFPKTVLPGALGGVSEVVTPHPCSAPQLDIMRHERKDHIGPHGRSYVQVMCSLPSDSCRTTWVLSKTELLDQAGWRFEAKMGLGSRERSGHNTAVYQTLLNLLLRVSVFKYCI